MNDFERRFLDVIQTSSYIATAARQGQQIANIDYFCYNLNLDDVIATGSSDQGFVQVQADSDFVMIYLAAAVIGADGHTINTAPNLDIQITDTGSGKTFFNEPTNISLVTGQGGFPYFLPTPRVVNPNTNLKVDVTNNTGANVTKISVSFQGARIFYA